MHVNNMEITILSAQGLKNTSPFSHQIKPFITLTTTVPVPPSSFTSITDGDKYCHVYITRVDDQGGANPAWGDKFKLLNIDSNFFYQRYSCIYLQVYTKSFILGKSLLGWCQIPAADILDGLSPAGVVRRLSYRLRNKDGSRGDGIVNLAVKLEGLLPINVQPQRRLDSNGRHVPEMEMGPGYTVMGVPVGMLPAVAVGDYPASCHRKLDVGCEGVKYGKEPHS